MENDVFESVAGYEVTVSELKNKLEALYKDIDETKSYIRAIFEAGSLIIALIGAFNIFSSAPIPAFQILHNVLLVVTFILYLLLIMATVYLLSPLKLSSATPSNFDQFYFGFIKNKNDVEIYRQLISNYLAIIHRNESIIEIRYKYRWILSALLPVIVVILLIMSLIPRVPAS